MRRLFVRSPSLSSFLSRPKRSPVGRPAGGRRRTRRAPADHADRRVHRPNPGGGPGGDCRARNRLPRKAVIRRRLGGQAGRSTLPPRAAAVPGAGRCGRASVAQLEAQHQNAQQQLARGQTFDITTGPQATRPTSPRNALWQRRSAPPRRSCNSPDQPRLHRDPRADRRQDRRTTRSPTAMSCRRRADPGDHRQPGPDVCGLSGLARAPRSICATATPKGGFSAVVIRLRLPDGKSTGRPASSTSYADRRNHRHDDVARRHPQPATSRAPSRRTRCARTDRRRIRHRDPRRRPADRRSGDPARRRAVRPAGRLRLRRRRDNKAQQRRVKLGQSTPATAVVTSGLNEGEMVIVDGMQRVRPGQRRVARAGEPADHRAAGGVRCRPAARRTEAKP